ncbi:hypothetical protein KTR66_19865, partial [Roseococcus sp. SDR]|uniref:hypothetical protein n=1 Tax=Roseococcus sp. SDR TaxID=2835532 RepID=UPI001BCEFCD4
MPRDDLRRRPGRQPPLRATCWGRGVAGVWEAGACVVRGGVRVVAAGRVCGVAGCVAGRAAREGWLAAGWVAG